MAVRRASEREDTRQPTSVRMNSELRAKIEDAASRAGRSLTQEIEHRLERSFSEQKMLEMAGRFLDEAREIKEAAKARALEESRVIALTPEEYNNVVEGAMTRLLSHMVAKGYLIAPPPERQPHPGSGFNSPRQRD